MSPRHVRPVDLPEVERFSNPDGEGLRYYVYRGRRQRLEAIGVCSPIDAALIRRYPFHEDRDGYHIALVKENGKLTRVAAHRLITDATPGLEVDHINGRRWDNRRENLRVCSRSQNCANKSRSHTARSGFRGVYPIASSGRWYAATSYQGKPKYIASFDSATEAAIGYNRFARKAWPGFYSRNHIPVLRTTTTAWNSTTTNQSRPARDSEAA